MNENWKQFEIFKNFETQENMLCNNKQSDTMCKQLRS